MTVLQVLQSQLKLSSRKSTMLMIQEFSSFWVPAHAFANPRSLLGMDHFSHWCQWEGDAGVQAGGIPGAQKPGQGHICLVWRLPGFCSELAPGPSPRV